jgi:hypothetical protein
MNDFTKKELKWLLNAVNIIVHESITASNGNRIAEKIQSMIDTYCDHDYRSMGNHPWLHCIKCRNNFNFTETKI